MWNFCHNSLEFSRLQFFLIRKKNLDFFTKILTTNVIFQRFFIIVFYKSERNMMWLFLHGIKCQIHTEICEFFPKNRGIKCDFKNIRWQSVNIGNIGQEEKENIIVVIFLIFKYTKQLFL